MTEGTDIFSRESDTAVGPGGLRLGTKRRQNPA